MCHKVLTFLFLLSIFLYMKPVTEYQDYHALIKDFYEERKRCSAFSWREFARIAGFSSSSYLRLVSEGKTNLSRVTVDRVASAMELAGYEVTYFRALVNFNNAKTDASKLTFLKEMQSIAMEHKVRVVDKDVIEYYDGWKNSVIRELAPLMPGATPGMMASACCNKVSAADISKSLAFLTRAGFLKKEEEGVFRQTESSVSASKEGLALAVRSMQREMLGLAVESIDRFDPEERNISGVTLGINRECYERIVQVIEDCRRKIIALASECESIEQIYRLNLQLFPLTWKMGEFKEGKDE